MPAIALPDLAGVAPAAPTSPLRIAAPGDSAQTWTAIACVTPIILASFALRVALLDSHSFWGDEGYSVYAAHLPLHEIGTGPDASQAPLYYILLRGWMEIAGDTEYATRFLSALFGVGMVPVLYQAAIRLFCHRIAILAVALAAISPMYIYYSQEVRPYAMLALLATVMLVLLLQAVPSGRRTLPFRHSLAPWAAYSLVAGVAAYTHYGAILVAGFWPPLMLLLIWWRDRSPASIGLLLRGLLLASLSVAGICLMLAPWVWRQAQQMRDAFEVSAGILSLPDVLASTAIVFTLGNGVSQVDKVGIGLAQPMSQVAIKSALLISAPAIMLLLVGIAGRRGQRLDGPILGAMLVLPILSAFLYAIGRHDIHPRYLISTSPIWVILIATGLGHLWVHRVLALLAGVALLAVSAYALFRYYPDSSFDRDDWRSAVRYIVSQERSGDAIVVDAPYTEPIVAYYHRGGAATIYSLPDKHPPKPEDLAPVLSDISSRHSSIWLVLWQDYHSDPQRLAAKWLGQHGALMEERVFRGVSLFHRYSTAPVLTGTVPASAHPSGAILGDGIRLLGYEVDGRDMEETGRLYVNLYWQAESQISDSLRVFVHLVNPAYTAWGIADGRPAYYRFPTNEWKPGQVVRDEHTIPVLAGTPPGAYRLAVGMYDETTGRRLRTQDGRSDHLMLGPVQVIPPSAKPVPVRRVNALLGDSIRLTGFDAPPSVIPGGTLAMTLFWEAAGPVEDDYTVFVHLTREDGRPLAQRDSQPADGTYPTSRWQPDFVLRDQYRLALPQDLPAGDYHLRVGMYSAGSGERLPVSSSGIGRDFCELGMVKVGP